MRIISGKTMEAVKLAEEHGVPVDTTGAGPVFPEAAAEYLGSDSNIGGLMGEATRAVKRHLREHGVPASASSAIQSAIRLDVLKAPSYDAALSGLMEWVPQSELED